MGNRITWPSRGLLIGCLGLYLRLLLVCQSAPAPSPGLRKPTVLVLGVYHMANPGRDVINTVVDDHLLASRQQEIQAVVERLKRFRPTKIAIEAPSGSEGKLKQYQRFVAGKYTLTANEIDQLGFRLGKALHHATLYPIDYPKELDFEAVLTFLQATGQTAVIASGQQEMTRVAQVIDEFVRTHSVIEILRQMNTQEALAQSHQPYLEMAKVGQEANYVGADLVASWYERNLKIFANLTRIVTSEEDRILVIIGVGHVKLLLDLIADSQQFVLAQVQDYL